MQHSSSSGAVCSSSELRLPLKDSQAAAAFPGSDAGEGGSAASCRGAAGLTSDAAAWHRYRLTTGAMVCGHSLSQPQLQVGPTSSRRAELTRCSSESLTPRMPLWNRPRLDPALHQSPAGSRSSVFPRQQNHFSSSDGPVRAPARHFGLDGRSRRPTSCPPYSARTDPITHHSTSEATLAAARETSRSMRRMGYTSPAAASTWSLAAAAEAEARATAAGDAAAGPDNATHRSLPRAASADHVKFSSRVLVSPRGDTMYHVAGAEDMLPAATKSHLPCDEPPSAGLSRVNDRRALPLYERMASMRNAAIAAAAAVEAAKAAGKPVPTPTPQSSPRVAEAFSAWGCGDNVKHEHIQSAQASLPVSRPRNPSLRTSSGMRGCMEPENTSGRRPLRLFKDPLRSTGKGTQISPSAVQLSPAPMSARSARTALAGGGTRSGVGGSSANAACRAQKLPDRFQVVAR
eukprot:TRINITY_DN105442_c0_g1_i1.p1 TRINITY_DN105442_c0_g1~~TRINITY_DN105442_c0_g1_i1.p1  ORF type:complete len:460 (+),score=64.61 TRINITY_DN105442_c0_g1_i1:65-1444(+)